uniref:Cleavage inducing molecular chaperone Jiv domain-containing protein n=1 Tax=Sinocyclocheilus grahami TaxID=75366 RepID=A0A672R3D2_SINGR
MKRMAATELSKSMNEFLTKLQDDLKEAINTMMCTKCEGKHKRFEMEREPGEARFCAECSKWHSAEEGDLWAESSMLGLRITYFAFMDGKVFDITEWAGCQHISISPDTHRVPYHISFGSKGSSGTSGTSPFLQTHIACHITSLLALKVAAEPVEPAATGNRSFPRLMIHKATF